MKDIQSLYDNRNIKINEVGISDIIYPINFFDGKKNISTVATFKLGVELQAKRKGTHMSRFVEILQEKNNINYINLIDVLTTTLQKLDSPRASIEVEFNYFYEVFSPITNKNSLLDIKAMIYGSFGKDKKLNIRYDIPITTLCPCSKEISSYGAHNQRANLIVDIDYNADNSKHLIDKIIDVGSSRVYPLLKREDEKFVTEKAFDNPKFVEDVVRDVAIILKNENIGYNFIEVRSFESIHNHIAYAKIYGE